MEHAFGKAIVGKRDIWLWALYDFANSMAFAGVMFYFSLWFVVDLGASDLWISVAVAVVTILLVFTLPILGHLSDHMRRRMPFLAMMSFLCIVSLLLLGFIGNTLESLTQISTVIIIVLYFCFQYFYQASFAFYDAYLQDLRRTGISVEKISGIGMAMGQLGNLFGLALLIPFALGKVPLPWLSGKPAAFIVAAVLFFLFFLPTLFFLKDSRIVSSYQSERSALGKPIRQTFADLRHLHRYPGVLPYLISYFLFSDALLTLTIFATLYLEVVGELSDLEKNGVVFAAVLFGILGACMSSQFVRWLGGLKKAITVFVVTWGFCLILFGIARNPFVFMIIAILNGFTFSILFALSRAFYALLIPKEKQAELFSIYVLFERAASILGPLVWSGAAFFFSSYGPDKYRFSVFALAFLVFVSAIPLRFVHEPKSE